MLTRTFKIRDSEIARAIIADVRASGSEGITGPELMRSVQSQFEDGIDANIIKALVGEMTNDLDMLTVTGNKIRLADDNVALFFHLPKMKNEEVMMLALSCLLQQAGTGRFIKPSFIADELLMRANVPA